MIALASLGEELALLPHCRAFVAHWERWRQGNPVPRRGDVRPEELQSGMHASLILEVETRERAIFRVAPSAIESRIGHSRRGVNFIDAGTPEGREERMNRLWNAVQVPCGTLTRNTSLLADGRVLRYTTLLLPVTWRPEAPPRLLYGSVDMHEDAGWLETSRIVSSPTPSDCTYIDIGFGGP